MNPINDGGPAFPTTLQLDPNGEVLTGASKGMSLRDWFAGQAMVGILASKNYDDIYWKYQAQDAYLIADAMIAARNGGAA